MNTKIKTFLGILAFAAFLTAAYFTYNNLSNQFKPTPESQLKDNIISQTAEEYPAMDFTVYDAQGNEVSLSDFSGQPVVLNFWASWCPPCQSEMPHFNKIYEDMKDDVVFMMVDMVDGQRETQSDGEKFIDDNAYTFPVYYDNDQQAAYTYAISSIPTTFFINADGNIVAARQGALDEDSLKSGIDLIK